MKSKTNPFPLSESELERIASRFRAIGEVMRLKILAALKDRAMTVNELVEETSGSQANVSKHLQILFQENIVTRRKIKTAVEYSIADPGIFDLCYAVCGNKNGADTGIKSKTTRRKTTSSTVQATR